MLFSVERFCKLGGRVPHFDATAFHDLDTTTYREHLASAVGCVTLNKRCLHTLIPGDLLFQHINGLHQLAACLLHQTCGGC